MASGVANRLYRQANDVARLSRLRPDRREVTNPDLQEALKDSEAFLESWRWIRGPPFGGMRMSSIAHRPTACSPESRATYVCLPRPQGA
jgi:hypothetical protein